MALETEMQSYLRDLAKESVYNLLKFGISHIGSLSLAELWQDLGKCQFEYLSKGYLSPQGRLTGWRYMTETSTVSVTKEAVEDLLTKPREVRLGAFLHECAGAVGYKDQSYEISGIILAVNNMIESKKLPGPEKINNELRLLDIDASKVKESPREVIRPPTNSNDRDIFKNGGSTAIGGGGNPAMVVIKSKVLELAFSHGLTAHQIQRISSDVQIEAIVTAFEVLDLKLPRLDHWPMEYSRFKESLHLISENGKYKIGIAMPYSPWSWESQYTEHLFDYIREIYGI